jgi:hypothetical protein
MIFQRVKEKLQQALEFVDDLGNFRVYNIHNEYPVNEPQLLNDCKEYLAQAEFAFQKFQKANALPLNQVEERTTFRAANGAAVYMLLCNPDDGRMTSDYIDEDKLRQDGKVLAVRVDDGTYRLSYFDKTYDVVIEDSWRWTIS